MHHMKRASSHLRYRFSAVEDLSATARKSISPSANASFRLLPPDPAAPAVFPDFLARQKKTFGKKRLMVSGAQQLAAERERF